MNIFAWIYFLALVVQIIIRTPFELKRRGQKLKEVRYSKQEQLLLTALALGGWSYQSFMLQRTGWTLLITRFRHGQDGSA
jgi:hypothetical protein